MKIRPLINYKNQWRNANYHANRNFSFLDYRDLFYSLESIQLESNSMVVGFVSIWIPDWTQSVELVRMLYKINQLDHFANVLYFYSFVYAILPRLLERICKRNPQLKFMTCISMQGNFWIWGKGSKWKSICKSSHLKRESGFELSNKWF